MDIAAYSKTIETGEGPGDSDDIIANQTQLARNSHDWMNEGCGICKYHRADRQNFVQKRRLFTFCVSLDDGIFALAGSGFLKNAKRSIGVNKFIV